MNKQIDEYIKSTPTPFQEIIQELRRIIHLAVPDVSEEFKWSRPIFKTDKDFAYIVANKNHVNLGFYRNIELLTDLDKRLEGTGKTMRHIKLKTLADIDEGLFTEWIQSVAR